jgi:hypothetical protein
MRAGGRIVSLLWITRKSTRTHSNKQSRFLWNQTKTPGADRIINLKRNLGRGTWRSSENRRRVKSNTRGKTRAARLGADLPRKRRTRGGEIERRAWVRAIPRTTKSVAQGNFKRQLRATRSNCRKQEKQNENNSFATQYRMSKSRTQAIRESRPALTQQPKQTGP